MTVSILRCGLNEDIFVCESKYVFLVLSSCLTILCSLQLFRQQWVAWEEWVVPPGLFSTGFSSKIMHPLIWYYLMAFLYFIFLKKIRNLDRLQRNSRSLMEWLDSVSTKFSPQHTTDWDGKMCVLTFTFVILVIGRGGEQISRMQQESGCKIQIAPGESSVPNIKI